MALTPSVMVQLSTPAPYFSLPDTQGKTVSLDHFLDAKALLVMFICNHCPYVIHVRELLAAIGRDYQAQGVAVVAINSNDVKNYPQDSPALMKKEVAVAGYTFPYLFDETQETARAYNAACTPDFFLYDGEQKLAYRGQLDDSRPGNNIPVTGSDLRAAIDAVLAGKPVNQNQIPSAGCNIKWK